MKDYFAEKLAKEEILLAAINENKDILLSLRGKSDSAFGGLEDIVYRFYHQSFKAYRAQEWTEETVDCFRKLLPVEFNSYFKEIVKQGTSKPFKLEYNRKWVEETKPIIDAYLHVRHMLDLMIKYGIEGTEDLRKGDPGWYTVLYLYQIR